jgi:hypothetical protein
MRGIRYCDSVRDLITREGCIICDSVSGLITRVESIIIRHVFITASCLFSIYDWILLLGVVLPAIVMLSVTFDIPAVVWKSYELQFTANKYYLR